MKHIITDLSTITHLSRATLEHISGLSESVIAHDVFESILESSNPCEIDIGIGILYIKYEGENVLYRFKPSKRLEEKVRCSILTHNSPLIEQAETTLRDKVERTYKELI